MLLDSMAGFLTRCPGTQQALRRRWGWGPKGVSWVSALADCASQPGQVPAEAPGCSEVVGSAGTTPPGSAVHCHLQAAAAGPCGARQLLTQPCAANTPGLPGNSPGGLPTPGGGCSRGWGCHAAAPRGVVEGDVGEASAWEPAVLTPGRGEGACSVRVGGAPSGI